MKIEDLPKYTWDELKEIPDSTVIAKWDYEDNTDMKCMIVRSAFSLFAAIGVSNRHPLAGFHYNDIPISCHWGLTFSKQGWDNSPFDKDYYWYGWDYSHCEDFCFYYKEGEFINNKKWLVEDVYRDMWSSLYDFNLLCGLSVKIANKYLFK